MRIALLVIVSLTVGCAANALAPVPLRAGEDTCAHCRMTVVSIRTAAQIVAPGEDVVIFDEIGCLRDYLSDHVLPAGALIFVADHRTGDWIDARTAVFTRTSISTPMASGLMAHADRASRDADVDAHDGVAIDNATVLSSKVTP
jgi:copper chaperone NosL